MFSIGRTINYVIRKCTREYDAIVVKTDVDIVFSSELIDHLQSSVDIGNGVVAFCANIDSEKNIPSHTKMWHRTRKRISGYGACFAMTNHDWHMLHGYDERIEGWGYDDNELWNRASKRINMRTTDKYPLFHLNHPERKGSEEFPFNLEKNREFTGWNNANWGSGR